MNQPAGVPDDHHSGALISVGLVFTNTDRLAR
jgi:hypothetical protein